MKPGTQADIVREFGCSRTAISQLVKAEDYRIIYTPGGKINVDATVKALKDSGFGKRSKKLKKRNGENKVVKGDTTKTIPPEEENIQDYVTGKKQVTMASPPAIIHRYKEFQQAEKERIRNEESLDKLIDVEEIGEKSFNLWRRVRDEIQTLKDRTIIKLRAAESDHEADQLFNKEIHRILNSVVEGFEDLDDETVKKKLLLRLMA